VVSFTPRQLYPREKSPRFPLDRRLGGSQKRSGCCGEGKKSFPYWDSNSDPSAIQPVAILTELSRLIIATTAQTKDRGTIEIGNSVHGTSCNPHISVAKRGACTGRGCMMKYTNCRYIIPRLHDTRTGFWPPCSSLEKLTAAQLSPAACFAYSSILRMEAACSHETSIILQATVPTVNAVRTSDPMDETSCKRSAVF
jgi:hypothetical protein